MKVKICDICGKQETEEKYFAQMKFTLPIFDKAKAFTYDRQIDLCSACKFKLGKIIGDFFDQPT